MENGETIPKIKICFLCINNEFDKTKSCHMIFNIVEYSNLTKFSVAPRGFYLKGLSKFSTILKINGQTTYQLAVTTIHKQ